MKTMGFIFGLVLGISFLSGNMGLYAATLHVTTADELQSALTEAQESDADYTIILANGIYQGHFTYESTGVRSKSLVIQGAEGLDASQVVLDGQDTGRVLTMDSGDQPVDIQIQSVTVQRGYSSDNGGGIYINTTGDIAFNNTIIIDNSSKVGGGVYISNTDSISFTQNSISNNSVSGSHGGGVYISNTDSISFTQNSISNNSGSGSHHPYRSYGGGVHISKAASISFSQNSISNNSVSGRYSYGGGVYIYEGASINFSQNSILDNSAHRDGGGVHISKAASISFSHNSISNNSASNYVGGVYAHGDILTFINNIISYNDAGVDGGGLSLNAPQTLNLVNNTIVYNFAKENGGGVYLAGGSMRLYNNIIRNNENVYGNDDIYNASTNTDNRLHHNNFDVVAGTWASEGSNINADSAFVSDSDYHLTSTSPCIDVGNNTAYELPETDKDGNARIINTFVDLGAYEYSGTGTHVTCDPDNPEKCTTQYDCELVGNVWWNGACRDANACNGGTGGFTQDDIDDAVRLAVEACRNDPASCGIYGEDSNVYPPSNMDINTTDAFLTLTNEKVYTAPYGSSTCIYGTSYQNNITIEKGAAATLKNFTGPNVITVKSPASNFTVYRSGATVTFKEPDGTTIVIPGTTTSQTVIFDDRSLGLVIQNGQVMLGNQIINDTASLIE